MATYFPFLLTFPRILARDQRWKWELTARTISGGRSFAGVMPMLRADGGGLWTATLGDVQVSTAAQVKAWRALAGKLDGGARAFVMEARDERFAPWPGAAVDQLEATNSDGSAPSDGTVYVTDLIGAEVAADAALRATSLTLTLTNAAALQGGEHFSIQHYHHSHRLYRIVSVTINDSGDSVVEIRPPLREATTAGTRVEFDYPKCVMRLATPDTMDLDLTRRLFGDATLSLIEDFPPFTTSEQ